ncbi:MAG: response regulator transcription factor [Anaerolineae bacterium]|jgi:DNA-binding response OmpR family regulator
MESPLSVPVPTPQILVVEDEAPTREALVRALDLVGYQVDGAASGVVALEKLESNHYDLMLLDLRMPELDGVEVMKYTQKNHPDLLVVVLTAHATLESAISAVRAGASDYLIKPCRIQEIETTIARALEDRRAQLKRQHLIGVISEAVDVLQGKQDVRDEGSPWESERFARCRSVMLDRERRRVVIEEDQQTNREAELTENETAILTHMMHFPDTILTCQEMARSALNYDLCEREAQNIVRPHISRLRRKIEADHTRPRLIRTIRGKGYVFSPP